MPKNIFFMSFLYVFIACTLFVAATVHSASIRGDMADRGLAVKDLKDRGLAGEDNQGYLVLRTADTDRQSLVNLENRDRSAVYEAIGKSQGVSAALVGERRARMIADNGASGHWLQKADSTWYRK